MSFKPGDKVRFTGGWDKTQFQFNGVIESNYVDMQGFEHYDTYNVLLETGSHHYGYTEQFVRL
jgi:hypothetical protein